MPQMPPAFFCATNTTLYGNHWEHLAFTAPNEILHWNIWLDVISGFLVAKKPVSWAARSCRQHKRHGIIPRFRSRFTTPGFHSWPPPFHPKREQLDKCILWTKHLYCLPFCHVVSWNPCWMSVATSHLFKAEALQDLIWFSFNNWLALLFLGLRFTIDRIAFLNGQWSYWCGYKHRVSKISGNLTSCSQTHHDGNVLNR